MSVTIKTRVSHGSLGVLESYKIVKNMDGVATHTLLVALSKDFRVLPRYVLEDGNFVPLASMSNGAEPEYRILENLTALRAPSVYYMCDNAFCFARVSIQLDDNGQLLRSSMLLLNPVRRESATEFACNAITIDKKTHDVICKGVLSSIQHRGVIKCR